MKKVDYKKLLIPNIPYAFIALFATKLGQAARLAPGFDFSSKVMNLMDGFSLAFENALPSLHPIDLLVGIAAAGVMKLVVYRNDPHHSHAHHQGENAGTVYFRPD